MYAIAQALRTTNNAESPKLTAEIFKLLGHIAENGEGLTIRFRQDFAAFQRIVDANPDREELSPMFDPRFCAIGADNGFWIEGVCPDGEVAHLQAVRFDDLDGADLSGHWQRSTELYRPPGYAVDFDRTRFDASPASKMITGRVCYHGELCIREDFRGLHLASKLANLAMLLAYARFQPDYLYCLIPPSTVRTGLSVRNGYLHLHPHGIRWAVEGEAETHDEYLVWMTGEELGKLMERPREVC